MSLSHITIPFAASMVDWDWHLSTSIATTHVVSGEVVDVSTEIEFDLDNTGVVLYLEATLEALAGHNSEIVDFQSTHLAGLVTEGEWVAVTPKVEIEIDATTYEVELAEENVAYTPSLEELQRDRVGFSVDFDISFPRGAIQKLRQVVREHGGLSAFNLTAVGIKRLIKEDCFTE